MTPSNEQDSRRPASPSPAQASVTPNREVSEGPAGREEARFEAPPTPSQLEQVGQLGARRLVWGRFIGRTEELAALRAAIDAAPEGQASLVMVAGEPGIGKTRLVEEAEAYARFRGAQVLVGRCYEGEAASPYSSFVEVLREYVSTRPDDALRAELGDSASDVAKLVPEIRKRVPDLTPATAADPREERTRLFDSVTSFLINASKANPIMLQLDDLHWADKASLLLLQHLARRFKGSRLILVGTYRDVELDRGHPLSAVLAELRRERLYERVLLRGLSEPEVKELIEAISQQEVASGRGEAFVRAILRETEGNPFFIEEVLRHLVESGTWYRHNSRWVTDAKSIDEMGMPEGVRDVIGRRLSRLSASVNHVLEAAAVLGREFEFEVLGRMNEPGEVPTWSAVEEGLSHRLLVESRDRSRARFAFTHALVRQTLVEGLSLPRRQDLHLKAAQAIEAVHERNLDPHVAELANHYRMAGAAADAEKTIDYSIRAGSAAFAVFAYKEAEAHWRAALELMDELGGGDRKRRADLLWLLGAGPGLVSSGAQALEYLEAAAPLFEELGDGRAAHEVHLKLALLRSTNLGLMDVRRAMAHFKKAEAFLAGQPESDHHANFYLNMAIACSGTGRIADGLAAAKRTMEICERLDPQEPPDLRPSTGVSEQSGRRIGRLLEGYWSVAAAQSSQFLVYSGSVTEGLRLADQARQRADPIDDTSTGSGIAYFGALIHLHLRNPRKAQEWCKSELAKPRTANVVIRRMGENTTSRDTTPPIAVHWVLVTAHAVAGELTQARAYLAEAEATADFQKPDMLLFYGGEWELLEKALTARFDRARTTENRLVQVIDAFPLARLYRFAGDRVQAVQVLQRSLKLSTDSGLILFEFAARSVLAAMVADAGDAGKALPHLERCREIVGAGENWFGLAGYVQRAEAVVAAAQGEHSAAEAHFEKAIATFQRYCLPWEAADTLQYWGRALVAAGERARANEKFDAAIEVYRSHGAGTRFVEYVMADRMRAQGSNSTDAEVQSPSADSVRANAPALTPQLKAPTSNDRSPGDSGAVNVFRREGEFWTLAYRGSTFHLKDVKGLGYIAFLLAHPGERIHVHELIARVDGVAHAGSEMGAEVARDVPVTSGLGDAGSALDQHALADYRRELRELAEELAEAERLNDVGRAERIRIEMEFLKGELSAAVGIGGRNRKAAAQMERARGMVRKNIRAGLAKIRSEDAALGRYFATSIKTGHYCAYLPDPDRKISWQL
jgi:tetratricopeptide (TPR) repeat protein